MKGCDWAMSYKHRKDHRTDAEFAAEIAERTEKENACVHVWYKNWIKPNFPTCELIDTGIDNTGRVLTTAGDYGSADFGLKFPEKTDLFHIEAKTSFSYDVITYKAESLRAYERRYKDKPFRLLSFIGTGRTKQPGRGASWFAAKVDDFDKIRDQGTHKRHDLDFGGKETYRIGGDQIKDWFDVRGLYV